MVSLLGQNRVGELNSEQKQFARSDAEGDIPLIEVVKQYKPTIIVGVTAVGGLFTEDLIREMAAGCERPIVFPLSNPTVKAECTAEQAYQWTDGRCIFASGSPFDPVSMEDGRVMYPSQCNNMYIFPGLGLGATLCGAKILSNRMLYVAAESLAKFVPEHDIQQGRLFPPLKQIRDVSRSIAVAVIKEAIKEGVTTNKELHEVRDADLAQWVEAKQYYPEVSVKRSRWNPF